LRNPFDIKRFWSSLTHPGAFTGVFANLSSPLSGVPGFGARWFWAEGRGIEAETAKYISDVDLPDTYWTVLDFYAHLTGHVPDLGISLFPEDITFLRSNNFSLSGSSMGLAMLIGLIFFLEGKSWPKGMFAWGNIRPVRNDRFALYGVDMIENKIAIAQSMGLKCLIHPEEEGELLDGQFEILYPRYLQAIPTNIIDRRL
jgi:hypothetical protein